ncbi:MAG: helix-turn-helix transcriptional regulator [bacterium]|nr:helix-turn-helix transcriptional regulator [bacterium]
MKNAAIKLGENLKRIRMSKGISQGDIARALDVDKAFISNIENGKANPTLATITKLAGAISVPSRKLLS